MKLSTNDPKKQNLYNGIMRMFIKDEVMLRVLLQLSIDSTVPIIRVPHSYHNLRQWSSFIYFNKLLQLNRRLSNNLYAFAGITAAPTYFNFNRAFLTTDLNKINTRNTFYQPGNFSMYSAATMGLMYINDARTFSVSGSISVERSNYPLFYNNQLNTNKQNNMPSFR